jgi:predicted transcriptional regulator
LVGGALAIVYARLLANKHQEPLTSLLGELMSLIVLPYRGLAAAGRERDRALPVLSKTGKHATRDTRGVFDLLRDIPMRLTYRTARVLDGVATHPGASNRVIGEAADICDPGQISKLLSRLERLGLVSNDGDGQAKGEPNAWTLTPTGRQVTDSITGHIENAHPDREGTA